MVLYHLLCVHVRWFVFCFFCENFDSFQFIWLNRCTFPFLLFFFLFSSLEISLRFRQFIIWMCTCAYLELFRCHFQPWLAIGFDFIYFFLLLSRNDMDQLAPRNRHSFVCSKSDYNETKTIVKIAIVVYRNIRVLSHKS